MITVFSPTSTCQRIDIETLPNNFIWNLDARVLFNLSNSEVELEINSISSSTIKRTLKRSFSMKKNTSLFEMFCVNFRFFKQSINNDAQIWLARRIPYIDRWSLQAWLGMSSRLLESFGCPMYTLRSIYSHNYALATSPSATCRP